MTDYWALDCERVCDDEGGTLNVDDGIDAGIEMSEWSGGLPLDIAPKAPFELEATAIRGYQGPPADFYNFRLCLMSERMVNLLRAAGVDNLQLFPTLLVEKAANRRWPMFAVNIIGRVAAADLSASEWTSDEDPPTGNIHFEKLVLKPEGGCDLLLFRLAENLDTILVHAGVKAALEAANLTGLDFAELAEWQT